MQEKEKFYITTPIYYGNGLPHIGHFYTSVISNIFYLYNKINGKDVRFTTGIDENSQKSILKAEERGMEIMNYLDVMAKEHREVWDFFNIRYTDFIRTTEKRHHKVVQEVLQHCYDKGDVYEGIYEGLYCVGCEVFKKDEDLISLKVKAENGREEVKKVCPDHLVEPQYLKEKNYFFKLSKYQTWLKEFYKSNPNFVVPDFRFNEIKAFVERGLEDFSISRENNTFGIPLPFDDGQITYVWFDALFNYYTSCKYSRGGDKNNENFVDESDFWIKDLNEKDKIGKIQHNIGKDIIRFHAIFWPAMLASYFDLGEEKDGVLHFKKDDFRYLPNNILVGGYFTVDGQKMSKSLGNVINPIEYSTKYSKELLVLYMLSAFSIGKDGDYNRKDAVLTYNARLANNFGNLLNRAVVLSLKLKDEGQKVKNSSEQFENELKGKLEIYLNNFEIVFRNFDLKVALDSTFAFLDEVNLFITKTEPWNLLKDETKLDEVKKILYTTLECICQVALNLYSFFPEKMGEVFKALNLSNYVERLENGELQTLRNEKVNFEITKKAPILFERFE